MNDSSRASGLWRLVTAVALLGAIAGIGYATAGVWLPKLQTGLAPFTGAAADKADPDPHAHEAHGDHEDHEDHEETDPDVLKLSPQARKSLGIRVGRLERSDYDRTVNIPGLVMNIPGVTQQDVTVQASGEIEKIYVLEGQLIGPGEPMFDLRLTHEEAIEAQVQLLDALAKLEIVNAEITRLEDLNERSPGAVAGTRLLTQRYERGHLEHTIESRRQILVLLGLSESDVKGLIDRHLQRHRHEAHEAEENQATRPLLERVTVHAPAADPATGDSTTTFVVENLSVRRGQHVDVGDALCRLGDYRRLYIEGRAFQRDLAYVRRAIEQGWTATAALGEGDANSDWLRHLTILYVDPSIDVESRSAHFYVELINEARPRKDSDGREFADWRFRPGQRIEVRVPVERFENRLVVPVDAIARDGLENYVFQTSSGIFVRRRVTVDYRDQHFAVLGEDADFLEGASLAMSGAYQLQLALLNRARGPAEHGHGGGPHSH